MRSLVLLPIVFLTACATAIAPLLAPTVSTEAVALQPGGYELDGDHAALIFKVRHLGFSDYVGRFERFDVSLDFDDASVNTARVEASIDMTSLDIANDDFGETLMGPNWFDAARFPQAVFRSTNISTTGEHTGVVTGDLTMHGVTHPITMDVRFNGGGYDRLRGAYVVGMSAQTQVSRKAFGVNRFPVLVGDKVRLEIEAEFLKRD